MTFTALIKNLTKLGRPRSHLVFLNVHLKKFSQAVPNVVRDSDIISPSFTGDNDKEYPKHIHELVDRISSLTLLEVADLSELLQKRLNIKGTGNMMSMMVQAPTNQPSEESEEQPVSTKMSFSVKLVKFDAAKKIQLIKEIKQIAPEMNLVQAKKFVESAPANVKTDVPKDEAERIKKVLEEAGASIEIE